MVSGKLVKNAPSEKTIGVTHLDDPSLYESPVEEIFLIILDNDAYVKHDRKPALFYASSI